MATEINSLPPESGTWYAVFSFPRLSREVVRTTFLDRFITAMFMDADGRLPDGTDWVLIDPDNWPEGIFVAASFDLVAVTTSDVALLEAKYTEYRTYVGHEFAAYVEEPDIEDEFLPVQPIYYVPDELDREYTAEDRSARAALTQFYDDPEWEAEHGEELLLGDEDSDDNDMEEAS